MDSGIRSGPDVLRALRLGANATFAGRAFLMGVAALGAPGADHAVRMFANELRNSLAFLGATSLDQLAAVTIRHGSAIDFS